MSANPDLREGQLLTGPLFNDPMRVEIAELRQLAGQAQAVEASGAESKLSKLKDVLHREGFLTIRKNGCFSSMS